MSDFFVWGFRANNPLDWIGKELFAKDGKTVRVEQHNKFVVYHDNKPVLETDNNASVCFQLNLLEAKPKLPLDNGREIRIMMINN